MIGPTGSAIAVIQGNGITSDKRLSKRRPASSGSSPNRPDGGSAPITFGFVSRLCRPALGVVTEEVSAAPHDRRDWCRDLGGGQPGPIASAKQDKLENGARVRLDSTVCQALMHAPSDSALLWDAVRVMSRLLRGRRCRRGAPRIWWRDRRRLAKKRARAIEYSRGQDEKRQLYGELIAAAQATLGELQAAVTGLIELAGAAARWRAQAEV